MKHQVKVDNFYYLLLVSNCINT